MGRLGLHCAWMLLGVQGAHCCFCGVGWGGMGSGASYLRCFALRMRVSNRSRITHVHASACKPPNGRVPRAQTLLWWW